ncbi:MAG TPA: ATP-dependent Clp protease proteolytic subunit [Natronosporangium sp.]|nr:ATP-dependent Clp protease proteolytic subunit [Natronosporangium sp.]
MSTGGCDRRGPRAAARKWVIMMASTGYPVRLPWGNPPGGVDIEPPDPGLPPWLEEKLFERRIVFLRGPLTPHAAATASASLLTLDAMSNEPVRLHLAASDGDLDAVLTLIDAIDTMHAPVHALATAEVGGAAIGAYAVARHRVAYPHARFRMAEPRTPGISGNAEAATSAAGRHLQALEDLVVRVARATGQPRHRVEEDFHTGRWLDVTEAKEYGLVDEVTRPAPESSS